MKFNFLYKIKIQIQMKLKHKIFTSAFVAFALAGVFVSCEDDCTDCECNMQVNDVITTSDATEKPVDAIKFDETIIIRGTGLRSVVRATAVGLDDSGKEVESQLEINPTLVTDKAIILKYGNITVRSTTAIRLYSSSCSQPYTYNIDGYPQIIVNGFYNEFTHNEEELRVAGKYFYGEPNSELIVKFYNEDGELIQGTIIADKSSTTELFVKVPEGTADASNVVFVNGAGETVSKCKLRDRGGMFLNFDDLVASDYHGNINPDGSWKDDAVDDAVKDKYAAFLPESLDGNYTVLSNYGWWDEPNMIYYNAKNSGRENAQENLLGDNAASFDAASSKLLLKFEVYVPKEHALAAWFQVWFSAYGSEDDPTIYGLKKTAKSYLTNEYLLKENPKALPNAYWVPVHANTIKEGTTPVVDEVADGFYTNGWRTVAVPLNSEYFKFAGSSYGAFPYVGANSEGVLQARDFFNFVMRASGDNDSQPIQSNYNELIGEDGTDFFVAVDNFRIVKDDENGLIAGDYGTGAPYVKRDYFPSR